MPCLSMKARSEPRLLPGLLSALCLELSVCSADLFALPCGSTHPQTLSPLSSPPLPPVLSFILPPHFAILAFCLHGELLDPFMILSKQVLCRTEYVDQH